MSDEQTPTSTPQIPQQQTVTSQVTRSITTDTASPIPDNRFVEWAQHAIFALFGIGFVAWAVLVWGARDDVKTILYQMQAIQTEHEHLDRELTAHVLRPAHDGAAVQNAETRRDVQTLQQRLDQLEQRIQQLTDREYGAHDQYGNPSNGNRRRSSEQERAE